jgi:hypothetical protein
MVGADKHTLRQPSRNRRAHPPPGIARTIALRKQVGRLGGKRARLRLRLGSGDVTDPPVHGAVLTGITAVMHVWRIPEFVPHEDLQHLRRIAQTIHWRLRCG